MKKNQQTRPGRHKATSPRDAGERRPEHRVAQFQPAVSYAAPLLIALAAALAYANSYAVPFLYDDHASIANNPTIRSLSPNALFAPPGGETVSGRPLLNASFAVNYACGGLGLRGYHALNLLIHLLCALTLFGVLRRTLLRPPLAACFGPAAPLLALAATLLWTLHPLHTAAVTYIVQRAEALVSLFYLLTLYCFIRSLDSPAALRWQFLAVGAGLLGVLSKEVIASAPLIVLLYDRTFAAGSFRTAWQRRRWFYLALFGLWLPLAALIVSNGGRGGTVGFVSAGASWNYALIQCWAVVHYLKLSLWPSPLLFHYGTNLHFTPGAVLGRGALLILLLAGTVVALRRWPPLGFAGIFFFAILAPSSSILPVLTELVAEHRMYLPLAAVLTVIVLTLFAAMGNRSLIICFLCAIVLGCLTHQRNRDYRSIESIWRDTVHKMPENAIAQNILGMELASQNRLDEAGECFALALRAHPDYAEAQANLAALTAEQGRAEEALSLFEQALPKLQSNSKLPEAEHNYARALAALNRLAEAKLHYAAALQLKPDYPEAENNLALVLLQEGQFAAALEHYQRALQLRPEFAAAENGLGTALVNLGRLQEARSHFETALRIQPDFRVARQNLDWLEAELNRQSEPATGTMR